MLLGMMLTNVTLTAGFAAPAFSQQPGAQTVANGFREPGIESPIPNAEVPFRPRRTDWLQTPESNVHAVGSRLFSDQKNIWTAPFHIRRSDAEWLVPLAGVTTALILTDANFSHGLSSSPSTLHQYNDIRTGSVAALGAASGGLFLWSFRTHDPHQQETGLLAGEAVFDSLVLTQGVKFVAGRDRPLQGNGQGDFFSGGNSFPSGHSAAAWAAAGILAHEYPGPMTKLLVYGLATTVSIASVGSKQHFPSDVLIGSGIGWLVSEYVYRTHHNPTLGGSSWEPIRALTHDNREGPNQFPGSTYVPLDSWVYLAFDRLAALGYLHSAYEGTKPWSREQCTNLLRDAEENIGRIVGSHNSIDSQTRELVLALHREFAREEADLAGSNNFIGLESAYTRTLSASGPVLNDGYHFGETFTYDFGRPFRRGTNFISGASASATYGNLFFYVGGEFQHAPAAPPLSSAEVQFIADRDKVALSSAAPSDSINRFQLLDAYVGMNLQGWQLSFGNQSLAWGPGIGGSLLLSNNAAPFPMLRVTPERPFEVPGLSRILGPFSVEQIFGRLDGFPGSSQPWIYGQKISFKPFPSLEFAYGRTTLVGGTGHPLTSSSFFESLLGRVNKSQKSVPGDSRTAIEWTWRPIWLRDWFSFYGELENDDDLIPFQNLTKSVIRPGVYVPRLPLLPKWDLHFEWTSSTTPGRASFQNHGDLNYWNLDYPSGYTNNGNLMGNTVGREGVTLQAWTRFWISPRQTLDLSWKQSRVLSDYIPAGGKWQDYQASYSRTVSSGFFLKTIFQVEHISSFPLLFSGSRNNVVASVEIGFLPQWARRQKSPPSSNSTSAPLNSEAPR